MPTENSGEPRYYMLTGDEEWREIPRPTPPLEITDEDVARWRVAMGYEYRLSADFDPSLVSLKVLRVWRIDEDGHEHPCVLCRNDDGEEGFWDVERGEFHALNDAR